MSSQPRGSKRPRAILDNLLHPGGWRNKRARSGSRSGSPSASGVSTPGDGYSHSPAQSNPCSRSPSPTGRPGPSAPSHSSPNTTPRVPAPPPNEPQNASRPVTNVAASTQNSPTVAWTGLEQVLQALRVSTKICPPLSSAVGDLASCLPLFETAARNRADYNELLTGLKSMIDLLIRHLNDASSEEFLDTVTETVEIMREEVESINNHQSRNIPRRMLGALNTEDDLIRRYRRIEQLFHQLQGEANLSTWSGMNELRVDNHLEKLVPIHSARFNSGFSTEVSRRGCTKGTRIKILEDFIAWSENPDLAKIYWMNGMAGTGKTTIAYSFCERLEAGKRLAASFFCTARTSSGCHEAKRIIPTIAYQLARRFAPFRYSLFQQLKKDPDIITSQLSYQFDFLLKKPLLAAKDKLSNNLVIVVDALDECNDPHIVELFIDLLFRSVVELPVKFFVTSRPEPAIRNKMMPENERSRSILYLHEIELSLVQADIELYLREELASIAPADEDIAELAEHAGNFFIYAATAVRYILPAGAAVDSKDRLKDILALSTESKTPLSPINDLYTLILTAAIDNKVLKPNEKNRMRLVLQTAVCACEPIPIHTLSMLSGIVDENRVVAALQPLRSVLHVSDQSELVTTLHASFPDYMLTQERSRAFYCDKAIHSELLAVQCFRVMKAQLRFNICSIPSSFMSNDQIPELGGRINTNISKELFYACRFWVDHLSEAKSQGALFLLANEFLSQQLLFWMEVMSLKRCMALAATNITKLCTWLNQVHADADTELLALASDARRFVTRYASSSIASYTPHIYLSALPLSPSSSSMRSRYLPRFKGLIKVSGVILDKLETAALATWELTSSIRAAFSPGGDCVVLGDDKGIISVQNAHDGKYLVQPFKAHTNLVSSLGVSSDGTQIVSGSYDMTLSIWNIHDGSLIAGPFKGHTKRITSVAFSPDAAHIVSGSDDCTVGIWSPQNVNIPMRLLTGHAKEVKSVAFSPDGSRVVSGSVDRTIRLW
ncbi:unnamed protein product [Rhizoctonia solani]|uniref:NACHT domain-containing protein n=1 Tax=Rhizoctonia solani TaxID=456999 RepID=A0A8H3HK21_9AGAM|nr:unnamed protein product [Rhizoctonia solani]CAE6516717.1 unnamed protein product [Rhizoctonia solani]